MPRLIDADALMDYIKGYRLGKIPKGELKWKIENSPTVDAVPVAQGKWIMRGGKRYCSACHQRACVTRDSDDFWYTVGTNYCPNCGARMKWTVMGNDDGKVD